MVRKGIFWNIPLKLKNIQYYYKIYIPELDLVPTQISPNKEIFQYKSKAILLNNIPQMWCQAELYCKYHFGGVLVMPKTEEISKHLAEISVSGMNLDNLWIGLKKNYYWVDRRPLR